MVARRTLLLLSFVATCHGFLHSSSTFGLLGKPKAVGLRSSKPAILALKAQEMDDKTAIGLGAGGVLASATMLFSEYTLKTTGCGVPAGPGGIYGLAEGLSYLYVLGLVAYSLYTKVKTGKGLPAGPGGILGAAEGLSFLAVLAGVVVLGFQFADYGYLPNAVPTEGDAPSGRFDSLSTILRELKTLLAHKMQQRNDDVVWGALILNGEKYAKERRANKHSNHLYGSQGFLSI